MDSLDSPIYPYLEGEDLARREPQIASFTTGFNYPRPTFEWFLSDPLSYTGLALNFITIDLQCDKSLKFKFQLEFTTDFYKKYIRAIGLMSRVFANGPEDRGSISRSSHTKDSKNGTLYHPPWHSALWGKDQE